MRLSETLAAPPARQGHHLSHSACGLEHHQRRKVLDEKCCWEGSLSWKLLRDNSWVRNALRREMLSGKRSREKVLSEKCHQEEVVVGQCHTPLYVLHALLHAQCRFLRVLSYGNEDLTVMNKPRTNYCTVKASLTYLRSRCQVVAQ
jgi:hypothetical protein